MVITITIEPGVNTAEKIWEYSSKIYIVSMHSVMMPSESTSTAANKLASWADKVAELSFHGDRYPLVENNVLKKHVATGELVRTRDHRYKGLRLTK